LFVDYKTGNSPHLVRGILKGELPIFLGVIDMRKFLPRPLLAPSYRFSFFIDEYPVGASVLDEFSLVLTIHQYSRSPSW